MPQVSVAEPLLIILGGIDGAGKSTPAREIAEGPSTAHMVFLDPDKIAAEIRRARPERTLNAANFAGLRVVSERTAEMLASRQPFVTETVLATVAHRHLCEKRSPWAGMCVWFMSGCPMWRIQLPAWHCVCPRVATMCRSRTSAAAGRAHTKT